MNQNKNNKRFINRDNFYQTDGAQLENINKLKYVLTNLHTIPIIQGMWDEFFVEVVIYVKLN